MPKKNSTFLVSKEEGEMVFHHLKCGNRIKIIPVSYPGENDSRYFYVLNCMEERNCMHSGQLIIMSEEGYEDFITALDDLPSGEQIIAKSELTIENSDSPKKTISSRIMEIFEKK